MAKQEHLDILKRGVEVWKQWREEHPEIRPDLRKANLERANLIRADLRNANLSEADLRNANLSEADLSSADLSSANLTDAKLIEANLERADLIGAGLSRADLSRSFLREANLSKADLNNANLSEADLSNADLRMADLSVADLRGTHLVGANLNNINLRKAHLNSADLHEADLFGGYLSWADFSDANLSGATLFGAYLREANLSRANLSGADARRANFFWPDIRALFILGSGTWIYVKPTSVPSGANLSGADLSRADLSGADLSRADLSGADLREANLSFANLSGANLSRADLTGCFVYATSAWDVQLEKTIQANLIITAPTDPKELSITVDNLEVAQFIYLLLSNKKIRDVIDTITSKVVLILGRFTPKRKAVLDAIRDELRKQNYLPVLFDFDKPTSRDIHETITTLARLARFVIADITNPKSIPQELVSIVETLPSLPIQPLLKGGSKPWGMYDHIKRYPWVLPVYRYIDEISLLQSLKEKVIKPAEQKAQELEKR